MTKFFEGAEYLFWVIVVGLIGGLLNLLDDEPHKRKDRRALHAAVGTASSMFVCWIVYEVVFFFSHVVPFSLAIGGFFAWQGAEYVKSKVDKALDKKIDGLGDKGYDYGDYGGNYDHEFLCGRLHCLILLSGFIAHTVWSIFLSLSSI